jgi:hypothetical protein
MFMELHPNPIRHRFHACRQWFRLRWFPCLLREFDRNMPACNTQQGYSPRLAGSGKRNHARARENRRQDERAGDKKRFVHLGSRLRLIRQEQ